MFSLYKKIRDSWVNSILFGCLLLVIFLVFFYASNLDLGPAHQSAPQVPTQNLDEQIKQRIGATQITLTDGSTLSYAAWARLNGLDSTNDGLDQDPDGSGLPNYLKYIYLTDPQNPDPNKKGFTDKQDVDGGFDPTAKKGVRPQVEINITKINISTPMVWSVSTDAASMDKDLENGVTHYPSTGVPGQPGNMIVSGHSSNYVWAKGNYNHIFAGLNNLEAGDIISVKETEQNGRVITFSYKVTGKKIVSADDQSVFNNTTSPTLSLTTCWPIGTNLQRLIVTAELM